MPAADNPLAHCSPGLRRAGPETSRPPSRRAGRNGVVSSRGFRRVSVLTSDARRHHALPRLARRPRRGIGRLPSRALRLGAVAIGGHGAPELHPGARARTRSRGRPRDAARRGICDATGRRSRKSGAGAARPVVRAASSRALVRRGLRELRAGRGRGRFAAPLPHALDPPRPSRGARRSPGADRLFRGQRRGRACGVKLLVVMDNLRTTDLDEPALWLCELAVRWVERGIRLEIICLHAPEGGCPPEELPGVEVNFPGPEHFEAALGGSLANHPDVLHVACAGPFGPRVVEILRELPIVLDVHGFWPICPAGDLMRRPKLLPCGEHYPFHACGACAGLPRLRAMEERVQIASGAGTVLAHSAFNRVRLNAGLSRAIEMIDYGVDVERFRPDPDPPW